MTGKISNGWPKKVISKRLAVRSKSAARLEHAKFVDPRSKQEIALFNRYKHLFRSDVNYSVVMAQIKEIAADKIKSKAKRG